MGSPRGISETNVDSCFEHSDIRIVNLFRISNLVLRICFPPRPKIALGHLAMGCGGWPMSLWRSVGKGDRRACNPVQSWISGEGTLGMDAESRSASVPEIGTRPLHICLPGSML